MELPEIPHEAVIAAVYDGGKLVTPNMSRDILQAAWPHLYAAALHDAAKRLWRESNESWDAGACVDELHEWSREALRAR